MEGELLKNEIWQLVRGIAEGMEGALAPAAAESGLTLAQLRLLMVCAHEPGLTVGALSQSSGIAAANVSAMCRRLERDGFLSRLRDPADERLVHICLTGKGQAAIQAVDAAIHARCARLFGEEDPEEVGQMIAGLKKLNAFLQRLAGADAQKNGRQETTGSSRKER